MMTLQMPLLRMLQDLLMSCAATCHGLYLSMHPSPQWALYYLGCQLRTSYILLFNQNVRNLEHKRTRFQKLPPCAQEAVQRGPSSIRLQDSVYNSSGLRQQDGHPFNFFPMAGRHRVACAHLIGSLRWVANLEGQERVHSQEPYTTKSSLKWLLAPARAIYRQILS